MSSLRNSICVSKVGADLSLIAFWSVRHSPPVANSWRLKMTKAGCQVQTVSFAISPDMELQHEIRNRFEIHHEGILARGQEWQILELGIRHYKRTAPVGDAQRLIHFISANVCLYTPGVLRFGKNIQISGPFILSGNCP